MVIWKIAHCREMSNMTIKRKRIYKENMSFVLASSQVAILK